MTRVNRFFSFVIIFLLCFVCVFSSATNKAYAEEKITYDESNVLDDLTGATIGGKTFDTADYPFNTRGSPQVIYFSEFCYSFDNTRQDDYALYVYVYNPQGLAFDESKRNTITFACGENVNYRTYTLTVLNFSNKQGLEGRFYKFKVNLSNEQKQEILDIVNTDGRIYKISEIELSVKGTVENYPVLSTYTYQGYSLGYGSDVMTESSLSCKVDGFDKNLTVDVESTYYRPDGTNGKEHTQDSLHSVYFSVDKDLIDEYGVMTAATATFYNALLKPILVTGNYEAYSEILDYLGVDIGRYTEELKYGYVASVQTVYYPSELGIGSEYPAGGSFMYNIWLAQQNNYITESISPLYMMFYVSGPDIYNAADTATLSNDVIQQKLKDWTEKYGDKKVLGKYSETLFEEYDTEPTLLKIDKEQVNGKPLDLTKQTISGNWWQKLWGTETVTTEVFNGITPIKEVDYGDLSLEDEELSLKYKIAMSDISSFRARCKLAQGLNERVYCLRYRVTDYLSDEARLYEYSKKLIAGYDYSLVDTNAYFFQMSMDLDFQIIDLTFTKDNVSTILPVLMKPHDIIHSATPPLETTNDWLLSNWSKILAVVLLVVLIIIFMPILPYIVKFIVWLLMLPIKAVKGIIKLFKKDNR